MKKKRNKKKKRLASKIAIGAISAILTMVVTTVGIDAVDNFGNMRESIVGKMLFGKSKSLCPEDMAFVQAAWGDFCIDKYEASLDAKCPFPHSGNTNESKYDIDSPDCQALSVADAVPWTNINQNQAAHACKKEGKRLPTNREWSAAAMGTPDRKSGWGSDDCQVASNWNAQPGATGQGSECHSFAGAYDMVGNVWEWVDGAVNGGIFENRQLPGDGFVDGIDESDALPSKTSPDSQDLYNGDRFWIKTEGTRTIARGGYWNNNSDAGEYSHYIVSLPTDATNAIGFRCVKNAGAD